GSFLERDVTKMARPVILQEIAAGGEAVAAGDDPPPDEQIEMTVAVEVARDHAGPALREARQGQSVAVEVPVAVVQVQPVLQRLVIPPELVAAAHDVQVRMPVAVRVEKDRVDVLAQTVRLERGLGTHAERAVALLKKEAPRLPFGAPNVDVVQPVAI